MKQFGREAYKGALSFAKKQDKLLSSEHQRVHLELENMYKDTTLELEGLHTTLSYK